MFLIFRKAVAAGVCISIGGAVFLALMETNKPLGAFMFAVGLYTICAFELNLFTGKIGYIVGNRNEARCEIVWLGNLVGTALSAAAIRFGLPNLAATAQGLTAAKLEIPILELAVRGFFCGILMYIAVHAYKTHENIGKYAGIFLCVPTFILCGFEHSVADMFYLAAGVQSTEQVLRSALFILVVSVSNGVGSIVFRAISKTYENKKGA